MVYKQAYNALVVLCPTLALAAGIFLARETPDVAWLSGAVIIAALSAALYFARPNPLKERIRQFNLALDQAPDPIVMIGLDGRILWANATLETHLNAPSRGLAGQPFRDVVTGEAWGTIQAERRNLLNGEQLEIQGYLNTAENRLKWTRGCASLIRDEFERPECIVVQLFDLVSTSADHTASSFAEAMLTRTLELTADLVLSLDLKGHVTQANQRAREVLLDDEVSLIGSSIVDFVDAAHRGEFVSAYNASRESPGVAEKIGKVRVIPGGRRETLSTPRTVTINLVTLAGVNPCTLMICEDITEKRESQSLLRRSDARFSRIFESSPDAILIIRNRDSIILDFNTSFTRLLGYTREEAVGRPEPQLHLFPDPEERTRVVDLLQSNSDCTNRATWMRTRSGAALPVEISLRHFEIGGELCILCIGRDITERVSAERALRESEEKFEQIFTESPDGIVILKIQDLTIHDVNKAFLLTSEYSHAELVGQPVFELQGVADRGLFDEVADHLTRHGRFSNREMTFRTKSGRLIPTIVSATLIDLQGVKCALCVAKDASELRTAKERLQISEQRFRGAFENAPIGILLVNIDGNIFQANRFATDILAYDNTPLEGIHISNLIPEEDRGQFTETLNGIFSGIDETARAERRMMCEDGLQIWTNFHIGLQRAQDGSPQYCIIQIADVTEMKNSLRKIERMAFYDTLTNLANRRLFHDRLCQATAQAQRSSNLAALLYLDLDQFKRVNDTLGHETGDALLQEVGRRLTQCVRRGDTVGRPGGDEFTLLLNNVKTPTDAGVVAEKVLSILRAPMQVLGHQLAITASIGITIIDEDGTDAGKLMKNADLAMYRAKETGRNSYQFYSEEMNTNAVKRLRTEYDLRRALDSDEFEFLYQPKVRLSDQQVTGVECLIRWHHPERGLLGPGEFIDVAEETGVIIDLGGWIISQACSAGKRLASQAGENFQIAVNISPRQFKDPNLVSIVRKNLRESGLEPRQLELEITETVLMGDIEAAKQTIQELHELGVKLAIDDFGTGYSSLNYLKKFPIDTVKVDRSFITDIPDSSDDRAITSAVIAMAHRLNMSVVAEGVENRQQLEFLIEHGCEYAQGYLFSKPMSMSNVLSILAPNVRLLHGH